MYNIILYALIIYTKIKKTCTRTNKNKLFDKMFAIPRPAYIIGVNYIIIVVNYYYFFLFFSYIYHGYIQYT